MKKTIFKGEVNGVKFDNVADYNKAITAAIENNTLRSANSSTEVVEEKSTCSSCGCENCCCCNDCDEDLTLYPYMDEDDPYYLDLLVTDNPETNFEAKSEAGKQFAKCGEYIKEVLNDNNCWMDNSVRLEYLEDLKEILKDLNRDEAANTESIARIEARREALLKARAEYERKLNKELDELDNKQTILSAAHDIIDMFSKFYSDIKAEAEMAIARNSTGDFAATTNCYRGVNDCSEVPVTEVKETEPQKEIEFTEATKSLQSLIQAVFGDLTKRKLI